MDLFWWGVTAVCALSALSYLINTLSIVRKIGKQPSGSWKKVDYYRVCFIIRLCSFLWASWVTYGAISQFDGTRTLSFWRPIQTGICMALWLLTLFCAIIQDKIISGKTWGAYMNQQIDHFSNVFTAIRRFLLGAERFILLKELQDYWRRKKGKGTAEGSDPKEDRSLPRD